jgi:hypothetical protein
MTAKHERRARRYRRIEDKQAFGAKVLFTLAAIAWALFLAYSLYEYLRP